MSKLIFFFLAAITIFWVTHDPHFLLLTIFKQTKQHNCFKNV